MAPPRDTAAVATYADHEVITPEHKLRKAVSDAPFDPSDDPVARAEKALESISGEFSSWMESECERLDKARATVLASGFGKANKEALFHAAHDIKGESATFGYPAVAAAADSLCRLIEFTPDPNRIPHTLVNQHVDAIRAIYREYARSDAVELATVLTLRLREVTDEFLVHENKARPDMLAIILGPPLAPDHA
ncbi:MAG: Hpt domain-containing protein [Pseudolabrys sp.]|nr:Hpt domain-containing protein [Pseudolabrys sp.]